MMNTLGLDDDLDTVEVMYNLETSFSVRFTDTRRRAQRAQSEEPQFARVLGALKALPGYVQLKGCASTKLK